jgi:dihydrofolate reductase
MEIVIIAAVGRQNRVIGKGMDLPWHIPADLKRFKALTEGHPILMGRRTFESLVHQFGGPLKNRRNLVLASDITWPEYDNVEVFEDVEQALAAAKGADRLFIGGGASVYRTFLERADRMELTLVDGDHDGDVFFPEWEHLVGTRYRETARDDRDGFSFVTFERR